jgi:tetratricopeptide (TPR) repeat protein
MENYRRIYSNYLLILLLSVFIISVASCSDRNQSLVNDLFKKGIRSCQAGNFDKGIRHFSEVLEIEPDNYLAFLNRGIAFRGNNEQNNARLDFITCIELDPNNPEAYFQLGGLSSSQGWYEKAIEFYTKAIEVDSNYIKAYGTRAIMNTTLGRLKPALEDLDDAISIDPTFPMLYIIRGIALDLKGDCEASIEDFEKAMSFDPENFKTNSNIAWLLATCPDSHFRDGERALSLASKALDSEEGHLNLHIMAAAYAEIGDFKKAVIFQERAIENLKEIIPADKFEEMNREKDLKSYLNQLKSYKNDTPWHYRQSNQPSNGS